jgi:formylglycine-generating enzyme
LRFEPGQVKMNPKDGQRYVWIPPGTFRMGCSEGDAECYDNELAHDVTITKGFWMAQTVVTQGAYQRVMDSNPSYFKGDRRPVEHVPWNEAAAYCGAIGGRLPTEAEWEYAARAGSSGPRYGSLDNIAWYGGNSHGQTHDVAGKLPNAWHLFDMLGNVYQWTADWYGKRYAPEENRDPRGASSGTDRVLRGGSWLVNPRNLRVSIRYWNVPAFRKSFIGFRCVGE